MMVIQTQQLLVSLEMNLVAPFTLTIQEAGPELEDEMVEPPQRLGRLIPFPNAPLPVTHSPELSLQPLARWRLPGVTLR